MSHPLLSLYKNTLRVGKPIIWLGLKNRLRQGKEDPARINERMGIASRPRPDGKLVWMHVASVGEAQSIRILIDEFLASNSDLHILVTSGTRTSADLLTKTLPMRAIHQYVPFDHPDWVRAFLDHWQPNMVLWVESELWPNLLMQIQKRHIPAALLNARLSFKSARNWSYSRGLLSELLTTFSVILCQSDTDKHYYESLGGRSVFTVGNIKFSAKPLPYSDDDHTALSQLLAGRPTWIYASTHFDEESIARDIHLSLKKDIPNLLTIIAPRHPERTDKILETISSPNIKITRRHPAQKNIPAPDTDIYLVDTMGELGLFYKLTDIAMIGRSLSLDGGGGHNPLESMRLHAVTLFGPLTQNLKDIYDDVMSMNAGIRVSDKHALYNAIHHLLTDEHHKKFMMNITASFINDRNKTLQNTLDELEPLCLETGLTPPRSHLLSEG
jgi:3-deoxy-D-manno-octulosonic-acid transferase